uniref:Ribosomal protein S27 n=1 Tax=Lates calcarifer TaxID=8187 RepID=A0A4W6FCX0_LATCA
MPLAKDLLHPSPEEEKRRHKKKRLVQSPNSYFMDVKCPGNFFLYTQMLRLILKFSHSRAGVYLPQFESVNWCLVCLPPQDATRSRRCSAMLRQSCCVWAVQQSCVSPLEAKHVSQRVSITPQKTCYQTLTIK